jgi:ADP-heptose:LPS heptosyltransferase
MLTAAVRDLHKAYPQQFETDVRSSADDLWKHNPYLTPLREADAGVEVLDMHYPLIHESNTRPLHFIHGYPDFLERRLSLRIPVTQFSGDIHLTDSEKSSPPDHLGIPEGQRFWIIVAGGKYDFTAKWWNPASYQAIVDHFRGKIQFVQCGEAGHWHPRLSGVIDLVGRTGLRDFIRLMHFAHGVVCPVTFAMHLAAAVDSRPDRPKHRACVVIAGGREPAHWEAYPHHQFISTNGALPCCNDGGCWKSRCQKVGDGDRKDFEDLCEAPVEVTAGLSIPKCMDMITVDDVIRRIEIYFEGGAFQYDNPDISQPSADFALHTKLNSGRSGSVSQRDNAARRVNVVFHHGLGDCANFARMIPLYARRGFEIGVKCTPDKNLLFEAVGVRILSQDDTAEQHAWGYPSGGTFEGHGRYWVGSKIGHNLSEWPLPDIGDKEQLWPELISSSVPVSSHVSQQDIETVQRWLNSLARPITLLHSKGNSGQERKSLPDELTTEFYREFLNRCQGTLILLDWDRRVPRIASARVRHLDDLGSCTTGRMLALMLNADLLVGVDSGPLHTANIVGIPTIGVWMPGHYPATYTLPRANQLNVVLTEHTRQWNRFKRIPWRIVEHSGSSFDAVRLAEFCRLMQNPSRYSIEDKAADIQLQQFILDWCRSRTTTGSGLSNYWDRNRSLDVLFREMANRFAEPTVVETGTIRSEEDWSGAGFFTYLAGCYLSRKGGRLHSVDINPENCAFARSWTEQFGSQVQIHEQDSVSFLSAFNRQIDVLYVDSLDTTEPNHAQHALTEFRVAEKLLHEGTIVCVDDSPWSAGAYVGKGALLVPFLLDQGWKILYAGYQVLLSKTARCTSDEGHVMSF